MTEASKPVRGMWRIRAKDVGVSLPERGGGVTLKGGETDDLLPMNPEGVEVDAPQGGRMSIKDYVRWTPCSSVCIPKP